MKVKLCILIFVFASNFYGQLKPSQWSVGLRLNRLDFFEENTFRFEQKNVAHELGLGFGINRSIFQQRFFPEFVYGLATNFKPLSWFHCQGQLTYYLSAYQVNKQHAERHFFNELIFGTYLAVGKRNCFYFLPQIGLQTESFHSDYFDKLEQHYTFAYSAKIGFTHAF